MAGKNKKNAGTSTTAAGTQASSSSTTTGSQAETSSFPPAPSTTKTPSSTSATGTTTATKPVAPQGQQSNSSASGSAATAATLPRPVSSQSRGIPASTTVRINNTSEDASERAPLLVSTTTSRRNNPPTSHPEEEEEVEPTLLESLNAILRLNKYTNWLLVIIPFAIASNYLSWGETSTFVLNFLAIIPLAKLLDLATDQLSDRVGQSLGALLNASFGNAVELIIGVLGLKEGLLDVVQSSIIGSILSNLLFVLGFCFLLGGLYHPTQKFNADIANVASSLLVMAIFGFLLPAAFAGQLGNPTSESDPKAHHLIVLLSRGTAIFLLIAYVAYLLFQLLTHRHVFSDMESPPLSPRSLPVGRSDGNQGNTAVITSSHGNQQEDDDDEEDHGRVLSWSAAMALLVLSTAIIAICAEGLVGSIEALSETWHLSRGFIGLIILPIVGNAAEHVTAVFAAMRNKMNLSLGVALGSSMQIALFLSPLLVLVGWWIGQDLTLNYTPFDTAVLFISIMIVNHVVNDGESNWLEGFLLLMCYIIVAIAYFYLPDLGVKGSTPHHLDAGLVGAPGL